MTKRYRLPEPTTTMTVPDSFKMVHRFDALTGELVESLHICPNCETPVNPDAAEPPVSTDRGTFHAYCYPQGFVVATDRAESDYCERGTQGCCVWHAVSIDHGCETW